MASQSLWIWCTSYGLVLQGLYLTLLCNALEVLLTGPIESYTPTCEWLPFEGHYGEKPMEFKEKHYLNNFSLPL